MTITLPTFRVVATVFASGEEIPWVDAPKEPAEYEWRPVDVAWSDSGVVIGSWAGIIDTFRPDDNKLTPEEWQEIGEAESKMYGKAALWVDAPDTACVLIGAEQWGQENGHSIWRFEFTD